MKSKQTLLMMLIAILLTIPAAGCKAGNPITGGIAPATANFMPQQRDPGVTANYISLIPSSFNAGRIILDVVVTEVDEPVSGIALKLTYPDSFSKFISCSGGDLFPPAQCYYAEPAPGSGEVFIGRTITAPNQATVVAGDQVIVRVEFLAFGLGQGMITIEGQNLGGGDASALLDVNGDPIFVNWYSGTLLGE
jgi:hypothetical protein